ncbi:MAG: dTDP-4-dehydrorhamnose reductase [Parcubacteria group bacterium CG2_30_36_18]|uniref:dTDP-4-dehydrorhamnose reductase n=1 Tax=Candidatus Nealsonbacteria bacterium CG_4_9_14_0_8_um_filter_36_17 TaxID=1974693 RepID=A0A2M8DLG6_9BACT|nr:MAG: dTDP-4-dehydrorhamnose reductase [Parcubacteria group bacterium CG2_30_36_18]PJB98657.1 MAG: NAD(P)-dependent oxidoreductase [Candidatus Nealsonbacteria bacterium CG_4_9_14_0_8_um_filter_36_17]
MNNMKTLITGASGKLGKELVKLYPEALAPTIQEMDIINPKSISDYISKHKPDIIIHLAALTDIRKCEEDKKLTREVNVLGTKELIKACLSFNRNCYFVYMSTACVFYGDRGNYSEDDIPYPKNFYSLTKFLGEIMVQCYGEGANWLIIRTNFVPREKWPYPKAFTDRWGTYLFADDLVQAIKQVVDQRLTGIVHICGGEKLSIYELAKITTPDIQPMTLSEYSGPPLTQDMSLISKRIPPFKLRRKI